MVADSASWPGIAYVNGKRFTDPAFGHSDLSGADGDITGSMNLWVKVVVTPGAETVEYVDSPAFVGGAFPSDTEYYEVQHQLCPISVTRFG
jgi:hypothetical protein